MPTNPLDLIPPEVLQAFMAKAQGNPAEDIPPDQGPPAAPDAGPVQAEADGTISPEEAQRLTTHPVKAPKVAPKVAPKPPAEDDDSAILRLLEYKPEDFLGEQGKKDLEQEANSPQSLRRAFALASIAFNNPELAWKLYGQDEAQRDSAKAALRDAYKQAAMTTAQGKRQYLTQKLTEKRAEAKQADQARIQMIHDATRITTDLQGQVGAQIDPQALTDLHNAAAAGDSEGFARALGRLSSVAQQGANFAKAMDSFNDARVNPDGVWARLTGPQRKLPGAAEAYAAAKERWSLESRRTEADIQAKKDIAELKRQALDLADQAEQNKTRIAEAGTALKLQDVITDIQAQMTKVTGALSLVRRQIEAGYGDIALLTLYENQKAQLENQLSQATARAKSGVFAPISDAGTSRLTGKPRYYLATNPAAAANLAYNDAMDDVIKATTADGLGQIDKAGIEHYLFNEPNWNSLGGADSPDAQRVRTIYRRFYDSMFDRMMDSTGLAPESIMYSIRQELSTKYNQLGWWRQYNPIADYSPNKVPSNEDALNFAAKDQQQWPEAPGFENLTPGMRPPQATLNTNPTTPSEEENSPDDTAQDAATPDDTAPEMPPEEQALFDAILPNDNESPPQ